jgi:hypothetical protein
MGNGWDDEELLAALHDALRARSEVPPELVEAAKSAYVWHTIDAELAELTYDSSREPQAAMTTRSESASIRALTFSSAHLTVAVEVTENSLIGQVMPPQEGTVEVQARDGAAVVVPVDEIGCFVVEPIPEGPFRLRYRTPQGADVVTGWITV